MDATRTWAPEGAGIVLLHVTGPDVPGTARGAYAGLLGRGHPERNPGTRLEHLAAASADQLLAVAAERLGRPCTRVERAGRAEREVVAAAQGADLLILARDGDRAHLDPAASAPPAASSSTTPPASSCWSGPNPRPAWPPSRHRRLARHTAGSTKPYARPALNGHAGRAADPRPLGRGAHLPS